MGPVIFVSEKMFEAGEQETAKTATLRVRQAKILLFQDAGEELLSKIPSILWVVPLAPGVGVKRIPVGATETLEGQGRFGSALLSGQQHHAPMRRVEL